MKLFYNSEMTILKKETRVIDAYVVNFYIVKKTRSYFFGLIETNSNELRSDFDSKNIPINEAYKYNMAVKAAAYTILAKEHKLMTNHIEG